MANEHRELAYPRSRWVRLRGIDVHHLTGGGLTTGDNDAPGTSGPGSPHARAGNLGVFLAHHFYGSAMTWRAVLEGFAADIDAVAMDRPGFGLTERPRRWRADELNPYTRAGAATLGWDLLDELGITDPVLVGSSAGGTSVLEMYAQRPERVRAIVLIGAAITGDVGPPPPLRAALRSAPLRWVGPEVIRRVAGDVTMQRVTRSWADASRAVEEVAEPYRRMLRVEGWERGLWEVFTAEDPPDMRRLLTEIDVPTLVVTGDHDPVVSPRASQRTAAAIPTARLVVIDDCGHTPQEERPERLLEVLHGFFAEIVEGPSRTDG